MHLHHMPVPSAGQLYAKRWWAMGVLSVTILISTIDMTILNVALPDLARSLNASTSDLQWIVDAYTIMLAGLLLLGGGIADRFGRKGTFIAGLLVFAGASTAAAFCQNPQQLIAARAVMGIGAALLMPPALAITAVIFPPKERAKAIGIWAAFGSAGLVLGPILGGILLESFHWGSVFLVTVPFAVAAAVGAALLVPTSRRTDEEHLDVIGALLSVLGLFTFFFGMIEAPNDGWLIPQTIVALTLGTLLLAAFVVWELRNRHPMYDVRVYKIPALDAGAISIFLIYVAQLGMLFLIPQYLQFVLGHSALETGLMMIPYGLAFLVAATSSPRIARRFGVHPTLTAAMLLVAAGMLLLSLIDRIDGYPIVVLGTAVFALGGGLAIAPATALIVNVLPVTKAGDGSSTNQITRQVGAAFGVALIGSIFASVFANGVGKAVDAAGAAPAIALTAKHSLPAAQHLATLLPPGRQQALRAAADSAFVHAAHVGLLVACVLALVGATVVWVTTRGAKLTPPGPVVAPDGG